MKINQQKETIHIPDTNHPKINKALATITRFTWIG
jgi:hypothetical protein